MDINQLINTPGSSYPSVQQQRPPSSHSASTPTSGHTQTPTFFRDSPQQSHAQIRGSYGPNSNHQYQSQPGTPLGPPTTLGRQGSALRRESPGSIDHKRSNSGGSHGQQQPAFQSPTNMLRNPSIPSPISYEPKANSSIHDMLIPHAWSSPQQTMSMSQDRERSISVSPKTPAKRKTGDSRVDQGNLEEQHSTKRLKLSVDGMLSKPWKQFRGKVPIFAQSARQAGRGGPSNNGRRKAIRTSPSAPSQQPQNAALLPPVKQETNGHGMASMDGIRSAPGPTELLGSWEPTITNIIPSEELTRAIMDQLIARFRSMTDEILDMVEIEAKIGLLEDKAVGGRVRIPVETECIVNRNSPNLQTRFVSSMTETQHSLLNKFLNKALLESNPLPPDTPLKQEKSRVPLAYAHFYETDTFYDLSPNALNILPAWIHGYLDRRFQPKVRISTDTRTGKELAKIIKVRVFDIEVYSPRTPFDWRVSVSLEIKWDGNVKDLVKSTEGKDRRSPERKKNRLSYKHGPYQLDLTQVHTLSANSASEKEHELEIELSTAAVREQIHRVLNQQPNAYEDLIKGFIDNVRTVARYCKDH